jgi:uncharacterized protein YbjQ (UPF0145 family)
MGLFSKSPEILVTTTPDFQGRPIQQYLGVVCGEAIVGAAFFKDFFAGIRDVIGGRASGYEKTLSKARAAAIDDMKEAAAELGANAIVGIDLDYEVLGETNGMLMVTVSGTAVKI